VCLIRRGLKFRPWGRFVKFLQRSIYENIGKQLFSVPEIGADNHTRKPLPVSGASDMQFDTDFLVPVFDNE